MLENSEKFRDTIPKNSETRFRKIPRHKSGNFRQKTGNRRKRSVKHHADSDTGCDRKFRKPIPFSKNTVTDESDRKISKSVSGIPKNSETVFIPSHIFLVFICYGWSQVIIFYKKKSGASLELEIINV
jgi:hypothetical protein